MASRRPKPSIIDPSNVIVAIKAPAKRWVELQLATLAVVAPERLGP
jgi:hypothetical protein